jgi:hypothetical protein
MQNFDQRLEPEDVTMLRAILWCRGDNPAHYYSQDWPACNCGTVDAMLMIRERYLSAQCAGEWWPIELAPVPVYYGLLGLRFTPKLFRPVFFENELIALFLK